MNSFCCCRPRDGGKRDRSPSRAKEDQPEIRDPRLQKRFCSSKEFTGTVHCEFASNNNTTAAPKNDGVQLSTNIISEKPIDIQAIKSLSSIPVRELQQLINNFPQVMQQRHNPCFEINNFGGGGMRPSCMRGPQPPLRRFQKPYLPHIIQDYPGSTVLMKNVPYNAGLNEILEFFCGFQIPANGVIRKYHNNGNGSPSGEVKVYFNTSEEASQAVQQKGRHKIWNRTIYLKQC